MNNNILLLAAAGGLLLYLRNKSSQAPTTSQSAAQSLNTNAANWTPPATSVTSTTTAPVGSNGSWLTTLANGATSVNSIVHSATSAWDTISSAFGSNNDNSTASSNTDWSPEWADTSDMGGSGVWAGPQVAPDAAS